MITSILTLLVYLVVLGIIFYVVVYTLGVLGIVVPPRVVQLNWIAGLPFGAVCGSSRLRRPFRD